MSVYRTLLQRRARPSVGLMLEHSPQKRNSDVIHPDSDEVNLSRTSADSAAAQNSTVQTPFKLDSDKDFDGHRREDTHYATSTSEGLNGQQQGVEWCETADLYMPLAAALAYATNTRRPCTSTPMAHKLKDKNASAGCMRRHRRSVS